MFCVLLLLLLTCVNAKILGGPSCNEFVYKTDTWPGGERGSIKIDISSNAVSWKIQIGFSESVQSFLMFDGTPVLPSTKNQFTFSNYPSNNYFRAGSTLTLNYILYYASSRSTAKIIDIKLTTSSSSQSCGTLGSGGTTTVQQPVFDYKKALDYSIRFYEAQRSGKLPSTNRISWRKSSTENDGKHLGLDLTGGYFNGGDYVKFNFPQAAAMTMLAWGMVEFSKGYEIAGQHKYGLDTLRWGMDYLMKCHTKTNEFYGQVANGGTDHAFWGRPEDITGERQCYKIDYTSPGSDLAGEVAAAMAASSIVFKNVDSAYSQKLLSHSKQLYQFADQYRGKYSDSISDASLYYKSWNGYVDELALASVWLYRATGHQNYLTAAEKHWDNIPQKDTNRVDWDSKARVVAILLSWLTEKDKYTNNAKSLCDWAMNKAPRTPSKMIFVQQWGSNRHAANIAFACLSLSKTLSNDGYAKFAKEQIDILLGNNPEQRSYVVGFGSNYPLRPHHRSSSCPTYGYCGISALTNTAPNPHVLKGALVGGPKDIQGTYNDQRDDYISSEVTLDYNAGFQSALAGLIQLKSEGKLN